MKSGQHQSEVLMKDFRDKLIEDHHHTDKDIEVVPFLPKQLKQNKQKIALLKGIVSSLQIALVNQSIMCVICPCPNSDSQTLQLLQRFDNFISKTRNIKKFIKFSNELGNSVCSINRGRFEIYA